MSPIVPLNVTLRPYSPSDADALTAIFALPELYENTLQLPWIKKTTQDIPPDRGVMIIAEAEGRVIGSASIIRSPRVPVADVFGLGMGGLPLPTIKRPSRCMKNMVLLRRVSGVMPFSDMVATWIF